MWPGRRIENPPDVLRQKEVMNLALIPVANSFSQLLLGFHKISTVVESQQQRLSSSSNTSPKSINERIFIQTVGDFDVNFPDWQASEYNSVPFNGASSSANL